MAAARKLQAEIDKTLKKVGEGIEVVEEMWERVESADTAPLREKYEAELKKEIKRLQKLRENLKTWAASSDVKQKQPLLDGRRAIEKKMEAFKVLERQTKTKAFSRQGLAMAGELDPEERARKEARDFLTSTVQQLMEQVDELEADVETEQARRKPNPDVVARLTEARANHEFHVEKLEQLTRLLDNSEIEPDEVMALQDELECYMEMYRDEDFEADLEMYDGIEALTEAEEGAAEAKAELEKAEAAAAEAKRREEEEEEAARKARAAKVVVATENRVVVVSEAAATTAVAQQEDQSTDSSSSSSGSSSSSARGKRDDRNGATAGSALVTTATAATSSSSLSGGGCGGGGGGDSGVRSGAGGGGGVTVISSAAAAAAAAKAAKAAAEEDAALVRAALFRAHGAPAADEDGVVRVDAALGAGLYMASSDEAAKQGEQSEAEKALAWLLDAGEEDTPSLANPHAAVRTAQTTLPCLPGVQDLDRSRVFVPRAPVPEAFLPSCFPQGPVGRLDDPALFRALSPDTLFFVFYHLQGTHLQVLAARQLHASSWRLHRVFGAWFQRFHGDRERREAAEVGPCKYFDFEDTWAERVLQRFEFRYDALEGDV